MKIRMIALAGVAALALSGPAVASDATGWYLGLGAGWDHMGQFTQGFNPGHINIKTGTQDSALIAGTFGYKFTNNLRLEDEIGYDRHAVDQTGFGGRNTILSDMLNVMWDVPLSSRWTFTLGGGVGVGRADVNVNSGALTYLDGKKRGFMYQGIAGFAYSLTDNVDITLDYRYRDLVVNKDYATSFVNFTARARDLHERVAMVGVRWYLQEAPPPPPPPP
ncbi:MAG TPA: outer membrane beta-barrel protein, partial [Rhizomicrobium sp.]